MLKPVPVLIDTDNEWFVGIIPAAIEFLPARRSVCQYSLAVTPQNIGTAGSVAWSAYTCKVQKCNLDCGMCLLSGQESMSAVWPDVDRYALSRRWYYHAAKDDDRERF